MSNFSDEQLQVICEAAQVIACECPAYLVDLFRRVRQFRRYTQEDCLVLVPEAAATHQWLSDQMLPLEAALAQVLTEFLQREHLLDEQQQVDLAKLAQRNRQAALRHQAAQPQSECNAPSTAAVPVSGRCAPEVGKHKWLVSPAAQGATAAFGGQKLNPQCRSTALAGDHVVGQRLLGSLQLI